MTSDALSVFKENQKKSWALFAPIEIFTTTAAAALVNFSGVKAGDKLLDVGCGTGVVAITAANRGAKSIGLDLSPDLVLRAKENAIIAGLDIHFEEGDVESLPYDDNTFDVVLSQFGHMFAPRPQVAIQEMTRVLKPKGILAFSTWPPDLYVGRLFGLVAKYSPAPEWVSPPSLWGEPAFIRQQLGDSFEKLIFNQGMMNFSALSFGHYRRSVETTIGPVLKLIHDNQQNPETIKQFRLELEDLFNDYYKNNAIEQHFLMSKANKK
ncbi:MAG: class I SAM-dependent methyltransferase [Proteobacteria bacterium]|nr:class I SAM-dependent methyltransferase [Pseudomonadota bacterium]